MSVRWGASPGVGSRIGPALAVLGPLCAVAAPAFAQTPPPTRDVVLRLRENEPVAVPEFGDVRCLAPKLTAQDAALSGPPLEAVTVDGAHALSDERLAREWAPLLGRPVKSEAMQRVGERVACVYREAGYVFAHATVTPEEGAPGRFRLHVSEGRVARVVVEGGTPSARAFVERVFAPVKVGQPLRLAELRRGLSLARSYGFWGVQPQATPSPDDPDALVLTLKVEEPKPSVYVSVQNLSAPTVGPWSVSGSLGFHLTPYDHTTLGLFHGLVDDRQQGVALSSDMLLTHDGLGLKGDLSWFEERPDEKPPNQDTIGRTKLARIELSHPLLARADTLVSGRAGLEAVNQDVKLTTGPATEHDRLRVAFAGVRVDARRGRSSGYVALGVRKGLDGLGASERGDPLLSRPTADPQATVWRFDAQALAPAWGGTLEARVRGQWADQPLLGFEEFTYGGFYGGRGLDPGALQGDKGGAVTVEWRGAGKTVAKDWTVAPVVFVDYARAWNEDAFGPRHGEALFGGGGARVSWKQKVNLDLVYAHPISEPHGVAPGLAGPRLQVMLTAGFDVRW